MDVVPIPQLTDNYAYLIGDPRTREAAVVDCADAAPVLAEVDRRGLRLTTVLATHHHFDHVGGNEALRAALPALAIVGSATDGPRIPGLTQPVHDGDLVCVGALEARVIFIPAHTSGHVAYHFVSAGAVFTGDTLFAAGCGRLFEGDAAQMMASLDRLAALPDETLVYCGHEYTQKNLEFAQMLEPMNPAISQKLLRVRALRAQGRPTVPSSIADEKLTNPFLRTSSRELEASVCSRANLREPDPVTLFAAVRALKDRF